tara:strand:+ start:22070 stop:23092 length:1023 start_codon:yes stop_codon:yes gene_type:complete
MEENKKMKILFDLNHPVDVNFFKNSILALKKNHHVSIIYRERGKLEKILKFELKDVSIQKIGEHKKTFIGKVFFQLLRDLKIIRYIKKNKIDLVACFGSTSAISTRLSGISYLAFDDDFEYKIPFYHANWFCTKHIFPDFINFSNSKTRKYHGFKELAYLHPNYLRVSDKILQEYNLLPDTYVFIREISSISLNYKESTSVLDKLIEEIKKRGLKIILSLENKSLSEVFIDDCILLEEPVSDIYSLLYNALFTITSGDTVARESAILGVPTIYTGMRKMAVNKVLVDEGLMIESSSVKDILRYINTITNQKKQETRSISRDLIKNKWEDTTSVILSHIQR